MPLSPQKIKLGTVPAGRAVLTVGEVAERWQVTAAHIIGLIEDGQLAALDVSGRLECLPVPKAALNQLAIKLKVTPAQLMEFIRTIKPDGGQKARSLWRVPVESYAAFMEKRGSLNLNLPRK